MPRNRPSRRFAPVLPIGALLLGAVAALAAVPQDDHDCDDIFGFYGALDGARFSPELRGELGGVRLLGLLSDPFAARHGIDQEVAYRVSVLDRDGAVLRIFKGRKLLPAGERVEVAFRWRGLDSFGRPLPSGLYYARFEAEAVSRSGVVTSPFTDELAIRLDRDLTPTEALRYRWHHQQPISTQRRMNVPHEPIPFDFFYGNPHSHTTRSDGGGSASGGDCNPATARVDLAYPDDAFAIAETSGQMDWMMVSEHNHLIDNANPYDSRSPHTSSAIYAQGRAMADAATGPGFVAIYGLEWGTYSNCGHVQIYDAPVLFGWEPGEYDVFTPKCVYGGSGGLYDVAARPGNVSPTTGLPHLVLNHPATSNMFDSYARDAFADAALRGVAVVNGPSNSCDETFPSGGTSSTGTYKNRLIKLLNAGFKLAPEAHQDNHADNYGTHSEIRTVVLAESLSRECLLAAEYQRRVYATQDRNGQLIFSATTSSHPAVVHYMGEAIGATGATISFHASWWDPDLSAMTVYRLLRGEVGSGCGTFTCLTELASTATPTPSGPVTIDVTDSMPSGSYYYLVEVQQPGTPNVRHTVSAPIFANYDLADDGSTPPSCGCGGLSAAPTATPQAICGTGSSQLDAVPAGGIPPYTYAWTPAADLDDPTSRTPLATPTTTTSYNVTVTDSSSCTTSGAVTLPVSSSPLGVPTGIVAASGNAEATISWDNTNPAGSYLLYRMANDCLGSPVLVADVPAGSQGRTSYLDTSLTNGQVVCYQVTSTDGVCESQPTGCGAKTCVMPGAIPEVSGGEAQVPFTVDKAGAGLDLRFSYAGPTVRYHLYGAVGEASIAAGTWDFKLCDLASNKNGTFTTDGATFAAFSVADGSTLPAGWMVIVADDAGSEGPYGFRSNGSLRPPDLDRSTPTEIGCQAPCAADLFISEYVEGSSNNKAIEIANGTGSPVSLNGYTLDFYFNGNTTAGTSIALAGTIAAGDVFVVADNNASAAILAVTDQTSTKQFFNGNDTVVLTKGGASIDVIGQIGFDPGSGGFGSGGTTTANHTLRRQASITAGDPNGTDPFDPGIEWDGYPQDDIGGLGAHSLPCP